MVFDAKKMMCGVVMLLLFVCNSVSYSQQVSRTVNYNATLQPFGDGIHKKYLLPAEIEDPDSHFQLQFNVDLTPEDITAEITGTITFDQENGTLQMRGTDGKLQSEGGISFGAIIKIAIKLPSIPFFTTEPILLKTEIPLSINAVEPWNELASFKTFHLNGKPIEVRGGIRDLVRLELTAVDIAGLILTALTSGALPPPVTKLLGIAFDKGVGNAGISYNLGFLSTATLTGKSIMVNGQPITNESQIIEAIGLDLSQNSYTVNSSYQEQFTYQLNYVVSSDVRLKFNPLGISVWDYEKVFGKIETPILPKQAVDLNFTSVQTTFPIAQAEVSEPPVADLVVSASTLSATTLSPRASFTLETTVRNQGGGTAPATTLRGYRSDNANISDVDTEVGAAAVSLLSPNNTQTVRINLTAPVAAGTYYYGVCVDDVSNESDTVNNCSTGVALTVENLAPVAADALTAETLVAGEASLVDVAPYFSDPNGDTLTYQPSSSSAEIVAVEMSGLSDSHLRMNPLAAGTATVAVKATDPRGLSFSQTFSVTVNLPPNRAPQVLYLISAHALTVGNSAALLSVSDYFNDPDGDILTYTASTSDTAVVTASTSGSPVLITPVAAGTATITVTASDGKLTATQSFTVTVTDPPVQNQAPRVSSQISAHALTVGNSATLLSVSSYFNDPDGDTLTYTASTSNTAVVTASTSGSPVLITPVAAGTATITVTADDGELTATQSFTVTVTDPPVQNQAPEVIHSFNRQNFRVGDEPKWRNLSSYFSDPDNDTLTYTATSSNTGIVAAIISANSVKITPGVPGTARVTVTARDTGGLTVAQSFTVTVQAQLQTIPSLPVCDRTPQIRDEIMKKTRDNNCANVTEDELESITRLSLIAEGLVTLKQGDFDELRNLEDLVLNENSLKTFPEDIFWYLGKLEYLGLRDNQFTTLVKDTFEHLDSLTDLTLYRNQITTLQEGAFNDLDNLIELDLRENQLTTLPAGVFEELSNLEELNLEDNRIAILSRGGFLGLSSLEDLYLEGNPIHTIRAGTFNGLSSLTDLEFNGHPLRTIEAGAFSGLSSLTGLEVYDTQLRTLPRNVFSGLSSLTDLDLADNPIQTIEVGAFSGLSSLTDLGLDNTQLSTLRQNVFSGLSSLTDLDLADNPIQTIEVGAFNGLSSLTDLDLDDAQLSTLRQDVFSGLSSLENLDLYGNSLRVIEVGAFNGLSNLISLSLDENRLTTLPVGIFSGLSKLERLDLRDNPGAPFTLTLELARTDNTNLKAAGPATVKAKLAEGAPFDMSIRLSVQGGTLSADTATLSAGQIESNSITVSQTGTGLATVRLGSTPTIPQGYLGIQMAVGTPLVLFSEQLNRAPVAVGTIRMQTLTVGDAAIVVKVSDKFNDADGDTLHYTASSDNTSVVSVNMSGTEVTLVPKGAGNASVTVTASDSTLTATQTFSVAVMAAKTPDLSVESLSVDKDAVPPGATFRLNAVIKNQGEAASTATSLRYYQSIDTTISDTDTEVHTANLPIIAVDAMSQPSVQLTAPNTPGTYYYGVCVDAVESESDTTNNCSIGVAVTVEGADLTIQGTPQVSKTTLSPGETFQLDANVWNQGRATSSATTLRYYLSTDATISSADTEVANDAVGPLSGRGAHASRRRAELSKTLTAPDTAGVHYYGVCVDTVSGDADTSNNCSQAIAVTVAAPPPEPVADPVPEDPGNPEAVEIQGPDLVFSMTRVDASTIKVLAGVRMHITLTNQGTSKAPATMVRYYRSTDATISAEDTELRAVPVGELGAGKSQTTWALLPGPTSVGTYYYGACVDGVVSEFDTSNNCSDAIEITVERQGTGKPQLRPIGTISIQALEVSGSPVVLNVSGYFFGEVETWTASSNKTEVVTVSMSGSEVTLTPVGAGWATVTVEASSGDLAAKQTFSVSVGGAAGPEPAPVVTPEVEGPDTSPEVSIPDANLRAAIRSVLGLEEGDILTQQKMRGLTKLHTYKLGITDLTGLEHATNLKNLDLRTDPGINDITPIKGLTALTTLSVFQCRVTDLSPLKDLTALTRLSINQNGLISDITPLKNLTALTSLEVITNVSGSGVDEFKINDLSPLQNMTALTSLRLITHRISDITPLSKFTALTSLNLADNEISDLTPLKNLTSLTQLDIHANEISDLTPLESLTALTSLDLRSNQITNVTPLKKLTSLTSLKLANNSIADLAPLRTLKANNPGVSIDIDINADLDNAPDAPSASVLPAETALLSNYPNPFNPETWIPYQLAAPADVSLAIYTADGKLVRTLDLGHRSVGIYESRSRAAYWDGRNALGEPVASGVYFYTLTAGDFTATRKMLIRK